MKKETKRMHHITNNKDCTENSATKAAATTTTPPTTTDPPMFTPRNVDESPASGGGRFTGTVREAQRLTHTIDEKAKNEDRYSLMSLSIKF
jgi:hypothetical protein